MVSGVLAWIAGSGIVQGLIMGLTFAYLTTVLLLNAVARSKTRTVNGWSAIPTAGHPGNGLLMRAASQKALRWSTCSRRRRTGPRPTMPDGRV